MAVPSSGLTKICAPEASTCLTGGAVRCGALAALGDTALEMLAAAMLEVTWSTSACTGIENAMFAIEFAVPLVSPRFSLLNVLARDKRDEYADFRFSRMASSTSSSAISLSTPTEEGTQR